MTRLFLPLIFLTAGVAIAAPREEDRPLASSLAFHFTPGQPLIYAVKVRSETNTRMQAGENSNTSAVQNEVRYKVRLTAIAGTNSGDAMTIRFEPFDYEADLEVSGPGGRFSATVRDLSIKGTQNGIVVMDSEKGIGLAQSKPLRAEAVLMLLSGYIELNPRGEATGFRGDIPFVDFWRKVCANQIGFFGMTLPDEEVKEGDSWKKVMTLKSMGEIKLDDEISVTNGFVRQRDSFWSNRPVAAFELKAPVRRHDIQGTIEQGGQSSRVNITEFEHRTTGQFRFDPVQGQFLDSDVTGKWTAAMTTLIQGRAVLTRMDSHVTSGFRLLPDISQAQSAKQ
jgi:hypothetical protein